MNMKLSCCVALLLLQLLSTWSVPASPQADASGISAIKTEDGYLVVWNQPDIHFTLRLKGKDVRPMNSPGGSAAFNMSGVVFQIQSVAVSEFARNAKKQILTDQAILIAHRDWESQYLEHTVGTKLNVTTLPQQLSSGSPALLWKFDMPKTKGTEQMYLTTVSGNNVVILNAFVAEKTSESAVQKLLLDTISTFTPSSQPDRRPEAARVYPLKTTVEYL
jgi:hypothetical protein